MNWKEQIIQNIKDCGQSLIDNAEKIANNYKYNTNLIITCHPTITVSGECPHIIVEQEFIPEKFVERYDV